MVGYGDRRRKILRDRIDDDRRKQKPMIKKAHYHVMLYICSWLEYNIDDSARAVYCMVPYAHHIIYSQKRFFRECHYMDTRAAGFYLRFFLLMVLFCPT